MTKAIKNKTTYLLIIGFIGLIVISLQSFVLIPLEKELAYHMIIEHSIFFLLGATSVKITETFLKTLVIYDKKRKNNLKNTTSNKKKSKIIKLTTLWIQY